MDELNSDVIAHIGGFAGILPSYNRVNSTFLSASPMVLKFGLEYMNHTYPYWGEVESITPRYDGQNRLLNSESIFRGFTIHEIERMCMFECNRALLNGDTDAVLFMARENHWVNIDDMINGSYRLGYIDICSRILDIYISNIDEIDSPVAFRMLDRDLSGWDMEHLVKSWGYRDMVGCMTDQMRFNITSYNWWNVNDTPIENASVLIGWKLGQIDGLLEAILPISRINPTMSYWECLTLVDINTWELPEHEYRYPLWRYDINISETTNSILAEVLDAQWVTSSMIDWVVRLDSHDMIESLSNANPIYIYSLREHLQNIPNGIEWVHEMAVHDRDMVMRTVCKRILDEQIM